MLRLIRITVVLAAVRPLCSSGHCSMPRGEGEMNRSIVALAMPGPSCNLPHEFPEKQELSGA